MQMFECVLFSYEHNQNYQNIYFFLVSIKIGFMKTFPNLLFFYLINSMNFTAEFKKKLLNSQDTNFMSFFYLLTDVMGVFVAE